MTKHLTLLLLILGTSLFNFGQGADTKPTIKRVSVEPTENRPGAVIIEWYKTNFGQDSNYILNRSTDGGTMSSKNLFFYDTEAYADEEPIGYTVTVEFPGESPVNQTSEKHQTIFLETPIYYTCGTNWPLITLNWSPYVGWNNVSYEVFYKEKNSTAPFLGIPVGVSSATIDVKGDIKTGTLYEFYVMATNQDAKSLKSKSNIQEAFTYVPDPIPANPTVINSVVNKGDSTQIEFEINPEITEAIICQLQKSNETFFVQPKPVETDTLYGKYKSDFSFVTEANQFYRIETKNKCNKDPQPSNLIKPINLSITNISGNEITLEWNRCYQSGNEDYTLFWSVDGAAPTEHSSPSGLSASVNIDDVVNARSQDFCFYIEAKTSSDYFAKSNTVCYNKLPTVEMPDAFTPNGDSKNEFIRPIFGFKPSEFLFVVYNRYGSKIYEMGMPELIKYGWDGTYNGKKVTEGAYPYYYRIVTDEGDVIEKSGLIEVVYP